jgi:acetylornithine deacetylase/succinyl-diaminopimelate desuccinylase-like protein
MVSRHPFSWLTACAGAVLLSSATVRAQTPDLRSLVERWLDANQKPVVAELVDLLSIPNVAADRANIRRNAEFLRAMLEQRGFAAEILETQGNPLVFGDLRVPGATRTLLLYVHYDGQPINPSGWKQASPFSPLLRDGRLENGANDLGDPRSFERYEPGWRLYARSASDDKSPIVALCAALDALRSAGLQPTSNLKVILDGEEEAGSPSLVPAIGKYRDKLTADAILILDGPLHPSEKPTLVFGARGNLTLQLTVFGPRMALHSGHYGNWVPNPAMRLAQLLSTFKDDEGRVLVEGFYDGIPPLTPEEQRLLEAVPDDPASLRSLFGIAAAEHPGRSLQQGLQVPSFNVRGLSSAFIGGDARTIVPDKAIAEIDVRLVAETPAARLLEKIKAHIRAQGWHIVSEDPDDATRARYSKIVKVVSRGDGTNAYRTSPLLPVSRALAASLQQTFGDAPVQIRTSGGTVPIEPFIAALGVPAISVPIVNFDNNQHGENENLRLGHFFRGVVIIASALRIP